MAFLKGVKPIRGNHAKYEAARQSRWADQGAQRISVRNQRRLAAKVARKNAVKEG